MLGTQEQELCSDRKRAVCTIRNEMKRASETVYKNGTFIATERSCT